MNPHEACSSWVLEKHLLELWRTADGVIRLKGVDTAVIARIVIIEATTSATVVGRHSGRDGGWGSRLRTLGALSRGRGCLG